jgi:hypothetical protein
MSIHRKSISIRIVIGCFQTEKSIFPFHRKLNIRYKNNTTANGSEGNETAGPAVCSIMKDKGIKNIVMPKNISLFISNVSNNATVKIPYKLVEIIVELFDNRAR